MQDDDMDKELAAVVASLPWYESKRFARVFLPLPRENAEVHGRMVPPVHVERAAIVTCSWQLADSGGRMGEVWPVESMDSEALNEIAERIVAVVHDGDQNSSVLLHSNRIMAILPHSSDENLSRLSWKAVCIAEQMQNIMCSCDMLRSTPSGVRGRRSTADSVFPGSPHVDLAAAGPELMSRSAGLMRHEPCGEPMAENVFVLARVAYGLLYANLVGNYRYRPLLVGFPLAQVEEMDSCLISGRASLRDLRHIADLVRPDPSPAPSARVSRRERRRRRERMALSRHPSSEPPHSAHSLDPASSDSLTFDAEDSNVDEDYTNSDSSPFSQPAGLFGSDRPTRAVTSPQGEARLPSAIVISTALCDEGGDAFMATSSVFNGMAREVHSIDANITMTLPMISRSRELQNRINLCSRLQVRQFIGALKTLLPEPAQIRLGILRHASSPFGDDGASSGSGSDGDMFGSPASHSTPPAMPRRTAPVDSAWTPVKRLVSMLLIHIPSLSHASISSRLEAWSHEPSQTTDDDSLSLSFDGSSSLSSIDGSGALYRGAQRTHSNTSAVGLTDAADDEFAANQASASAAHDQSQYSSTERGMHPLLEIHEVLEAVHGLAVQFEGYIEKVETRLDGLDILVSFGMISPAHEDDALRCVFLASRLRFDAHARSGTFASFGVATGSAIGVTVGSRSRREYVLTGNCLRLARDLARRARHDPLYGPNESRVMCDSGTARYLEAVVAKHSFSVVASSSSSTYRVRPKTESQIEALQANGKTIGRHTLLTTVTQCLSDYFNEKSEKSKSKSEKGKSGSEKKSKSKSKNEKSKSKNEKSGSEKSGEKSKNEEKKRLIQLEGAPGTGKTHILKHFHSVALQLGLPSFFTAAHWSSRTQPFNSWRILVYQALASGGITGIENVRVYVQRRLAEADILWQAPLVSTVLPLGFNENPMTLQMTSDRRMQATARALACIMQPFIVPRSVIFIDDVQWMHSSSFLAVPALISAADCLVITASKEPCSSRWAEATAAFKATPPLPHLRQTIPNLTEDEVIELASLFLGRDVPQVWRPYFAKAEGTPLSCFEVALYLRQRSETEPAGEAAESTSTGSRKRIAHSRSARQLGTSSSGSKRSGSGGSTFGKGRLSTEGSDGEVSMDLLTVRSTIAARVSTLSRALKISLQVMSVLGVEFESDAFVSAHPMHDSPESIADDIEKLERLHFITTRAFTRQEIEDKRVRGFCISFRQSQCREVVLDSLLPSQRRRISETAANWYEVEHAGDSAYWRLLEGLWKSAGNPSKRREYLQRASSSLYECDMALITQYQELLSLCTPSNYTCSVCGAAILDISDDGTDSYICVDCAPASLTKSDESVDMMPDDLGTAAAAASTPAVVPKTKGAAETSGASAVNGAEVGGGDSPTVGEAALKLAKLKLGLCLAQVLNGKYIESEGPLLECFEALGIAMPRRGANWFTPNFLRVISLKSLLKGFTWSAESSPLSEELVMRAQLFYLYGISAIHTGEAPYDMVLSGYLRGASYAAEAGVFCPELPLLLVYSAVIFCMRNWTELTTLYLDHARSLIRQARKTSSVDAHYYDSVLLGITYCEMLRAHNDAALAALRAMTGSNSRILDEVDAMRLAASYEDISVSIEPYFERATSVSLRGDHNMSELMVLQLFLHSCARSDLSLAERCLIEIEGLMSRVEDRKNMMLMRLSMRPALRFIVAVMRGGVTHPSRLILDLIESPWEPVHQDLYAPFTAFETNLVVCDSICTVIDRDMSSSSPAERSAAVDSVARVMAVSKQQTLPPRLHPLFLHVRGRILLLQGKRARARKTLLQASSLAQRLGFGFSTEKFLKEQNRIARQLR